MLYGVVGVFMRNIQRRERCAVVCVDQVCIYMHIYIYKLACTRSAHVLIFTDSNRTLNHYNLNCGHFSSATCNCES